MSERAARRWAGVCIACGAILILLPSAGAAATAARIVALASYVGLCWLVFLWGHEIYGARGALAATALIVCLPLILARAATADAVTTAACLTLAAVYALARCLLDPSVQAAVIAGVALGAAQAASHSALRLFGIGAVLVLARVATAERHESRARVLHGAVVSLVIAAAMVLVIVAAASQFGSATGESIGATAAFLRTPLPFVVLLLARPWRRQRRYSDVALAGAAVSCLLAASDSAVGGVMPAFPFLALLAAANWDDHRSHTLQLVASGLLAMLVLVVLAHWPDYASYVNVFGR